MRQIALTEVVELWWALGATRRPGVGAGELELAEAELGRPIPAELRALYELADGINLDWARVVRLRGEMKRWRNPFKDVEEDIRISGLADLRWESIADPRVVAFADNGYESTFAVWTPTGAVIEIGLPGLTAVDVAAGSLAEWGWLEALRDVDRKFEEGAEVPHEVLGRLGIAGSTTQEKRHAIGEMVMASGYGECNPSAEGRTLARLEGLLGG